MGWTHDLNQYRFLIQSFYCKRRPDGVSGRTLRWFCQPWLERDKSVGLLLGGGRGIITLRAADRDHGGGTWVIVGYCDNVQDLLTSVNDLDKRIRMTYVGHPDAFVEVVRMLCLFFTKLKNVYEPGSDLIWSMRRCSCQKQGAFQRRAPVPPSVVVQGIPALQPDSPGVYSSEYALSLASVHAVGDQSAGLNQWGCQGPCAGEGHMGGFRDASGQALRSQPIVKVPDQNKRGKLVEWVEKASFDRLNRLFEIAAAERSCDTLLSVQNLHSVMKEPQPYVLNILPRRLPEEKVDVRTRKARLTNREVKRKEGLLRKAPGGKRSAPSLVGAPTKKKKKVSTKGKEVKLPTPPKEFVIPHVTYEKEVTIQEPENPLPPSSSSGPGHVAGLTTRGPPCQRLPAWLFWPKKPASINQPDYPLLDVDAVEVVCAEVSPLMATPMEEMGAESQNLPSGGQVFLPFFKIDSRKPSKSVARPSRMTIRRGARRRWQLRPPAVPVVVPDESTLGETQPAENEGAPDLEDESPSNSSSGGVLLMMRLASLLALLAMHS
ncbi:hypothetical protein CK203_079277 [Vitis vinifera]|uniref:Uncharacterized protein n=1 Tax=Vitis vinifera TaxID=29760 RepID=A0A438FBI9_VITVI|nr:hypothetical protein CK203_079277 [Vitis vinifera]